MPTTLYSRTPVKKELREPSATPREALDRCTVGSGVSIQSDGKLSLRCDKQVSLEGAEVASGGRLTVEGEEVTLSGGFSVKAGATLSITTN